MQLRPTFLALALAFASAPLSAQIIARDPSTRNPRTGQGGTIGDIIFGSTIDTTSQCRVRDARTPDGRIVQICDDRRSRGGDDDDDRGENGARGTHHVNDRDGDGDFDANDRAIRKREHEQAKQQRELRKQQSKPQKQRLKATRKGND
jgi:hypothetical protein